MILNDLAPRERFSRETLDTLLGSLCELVIRRQQENPDFYGMVAAAVIDPKGRVVTGVNYLYGNGRVHAERAAIDQYEETYGELPPGSTVVTTLSPCCHDTGDNRIEDSCSDLLNEKRVKLVYCGYKDPTQTPGNNRFVTVVTDNDKIQALCKKFADTFLNENFADGKKPGRKGLAKRSGVDCKQSVSKLRSIAAHSTGERQRMAHWCANMKSGRKKH